MKKLAITLYVVSVLLISGLARAHADSVGANIQSLGDFAQAQYQTPVRIVQVTVDANTVKVAGTLPSPCYGRPSAMLTADSQNPNLFTLRLSSIAPTDMCIAKVPDFVTQIDLSNLVRASQVQVQTNETYMIKVDGFDYTFEVKGSELIH